MKKLLAINIFGMYYEVLPINGRHINKEDMTYQRIIERLGEKPKFIENCFDNISSAKDYSINEAIKSLNKQINYTKNKIILFIEDYKEEDIIYKIIHFKKYSNYKKQLLSILNNELNINNVNDLLIYENLEQNINIINKFKFNEKINLNNDEYIIKDMDTIKLYNKYEIIYSLVNKKGNELKIIESKLIKELMK